MIDYIQKFRLDHKTAFVVGGMGLIGKEVCKALNSAGAKIIALDLETQKDQKFEDIIRGDNSNFIFKSFDCSDINDLENKISLLIHEFDIPDIFINCSYPRTADWSKNSFSEISVKSFRENVDIHMNSYIWLAYLVAESMVKSSDNGGSIIQLGSIYGILGQDLNVYKETEMKENMTYAAIKGGITNFTRQMASYYGKFNIRVNTLCPGGLTGHVAGISSQQNPNFIKQYSEKTPLKRLGTAEEVASTVLFLASESSSYITGSTIMVDGGWSII